MPASEDAPFVIENGQGLNNANTFVSVEYADAYVATYGNDSLWLASTPAEKRDALRQASRWISTKHRYLGESVRIDQALAFPRFGLFDDNGYFVTHETVPLRVQEATVVVALAIRNNTFIAFPAEPAESNITSDSITVGPISLSTSYEGARTTSVETQLPLAKQLLRPFLIPGRRTLSRG